MNALIRPPFIANKMTNGAALSSLRVLKISLKSCTLVPSFFLSVEGDCGSDNKVHSKELKICIVIKISKVFPRETSSLDDIFCKTGGSQYKPHVWSKLAVELQKLLFDEVVLESQVSAILFVDVVSIATTLPVTSEKLQKAYVIPEQKQFISLASFPSVLACRVDAFVTQTRDDDHSSEPPTPRRNAEGQIRQVSGQQLAE